MPNHTITCPYCFKEFNDESVGFRMETIKTERENPLFALKPDQRYISWWEQMGCETSEQPDAGFDGNGSVNPWERPVYTLASGDASRVFASDTEGHPWVDITDGIVARAHDRYGAKTVRRVCPYCHNPLPNGYGAYPVKFIALIGISGAGKTVYLSQLCRYIEMQMGYFGITASPLAMTGYRFMEANPVKQNRPLPGATPPESFQQPLFFRFLLTDQRDGSVYRQDFVFYDIAGENLQMDPTTGIIGAAATHFGNFIVQSDAIIMLIDPSQLTANAVQDSKDAATALTVASTIIQEQKGADAQKHIPLALCISKADDEDKESMITNAGIILNSQTLPQMDVSGGRFDVQDYNKNIMEKVSKFMATGAYSVSANLNTMLKQTFDCYDYFMIESIGAPLEKNENGIEVVAANPNPKRIIEPLLWILTKLSRSDNDSQPILQPEGWIEEPGDWHCENPDCPDSASRRPLRKGVKFCPTCGCTAMGFWRCPSCGKMYFRDVQYCPNCDIDRFGRKQKKPLIGRLFGKRKK